MAIQVYVGNLSPQTTQGAIRRLFQPYGYITSVHLMADNAGRPCGFAFVTMDTYGAGKAITALHKKEVGG
jgi:polyadenylate-binding protein